MKILRYKSLIKLVALYLSSVRFIPLYLILLILSSVSCQPLSKRQAKLLEPRAELKSPTNQARTVIFLPIHHIGLEDYYRDIAKKTDSLEKLNFLVFYEQVYTNATLYSDYEISAKKFRKLTGSFRAGDGYLDTLNNRLGDLQFDQKYKLRNQPQLAQLGVNPTSALRADLSLEALIHAYEQEYGPITLDSCDKATPLEAKYDCEPVGRQQRKIFKEHFILGLRDAHLAQLIDRSDAEKILVIYGASHYQGLKKELKKRDPQWLER